jgi:Protein of unknown function (DUF1501)
MHTGNARLGYPSMGSWVTYELGYNIVGNKVSVRDLQATILDQLGLDPYKFYYPYQGLNNRLIGPTDEGRVLRKILA